MRFWDYGNAFLLEASRAGADVGVDGDFLYPSYVEDIMGPICFDYGFGPYRWVCSSGDAADLRATDEIAIEVLNEQLHDAPPQIRGQIMDNIRWISEADQHRLVVGSKARYCMQMARAEGSWPRGSTRQYPAGESQRLSS